MVDPATAERIGSPVPSDGRITPLQADGRGRYVGDLDGPGSVVIAEASSRGWVAEVDGVTVRPGPGDTVRFDDLPAGRVEVTHTAGRVRTWAVVGQLLAVLLAFSLALRPPGFARSFGDEPDDQWEEPADDVLEAAPASEGVQIEAQLIAGTAPSDPSDPTDPEGRR